MATLKENSRTSYTESNVTHEGVRTGALQRMADALEVIAKDKTETLANLDYYKSLAERRGNDLERLRRDELSQRKVKTRYKNQLDQAKATILEQAQNIKELSDEIFNLKHPF